MIVRTFRFQWRQIFVSEFEEMDHYLLSQLVTAENTTNWSRDLQVYIFKRKIINN